MHSDAEYRHRICRAIDFINSHLASSPTVAEIAAAAPFSVFHFQRLFSAIVGETVADFTRRVRLETAARHLVFRRHEDITSLAMELGFSSSQNFAKAFRKHFDVSPTEYREQRSELTDVRGDERQSSHSNHAMDLQGDVESAKLNVVVKSLPEIRVAYRRHLGSYNDPGVQATFDELQRWAEARQLHVDDRYLGIPWDDSDITPDDKCRFDACLQIEVGIWPGAGMNTQTIPAGRYATFRSEVLLHDFDVPWTRLMRHWLPGSGYQPADGPRFERYFSDGQLTADGRWDLEICLPVVPL